MIPKALYQDEIAKFKKTTSSNKLIDGYLRSMLETISTRSSRSIWGKKP